MYVIRSGKVMVDVPPQDDAATPPPTVDGRMSAGAVCRMAYTSSRSQLPSPDEDSAAGAARTVYLADNDFFGERSLLTGDPVSATVTALTYCDLLMLSAPHFASLLADYPEIKHTILLCTGLQDHMRTCGGGGARGRGISSAIKPGAGTLRKSASRQSRVGSCGGSDGTSRGSIDGVFGKAGRRVSLAMRIRRMSTGAKRSSVEMPTMSEANDATTPPQPQACTRSRQMSTDV